MGKGLFISEKECFKNEIEKFKYDTREILKLISNNYSSGVKTIIADYSDQRSMLTYLFNVTANPYCKASIVLRLTALDSLYSTNAEYSYFSVEEMAERIIHLGDERKAANYFYDMVINRERGDYEHLFSEKFGIRKNLSEGSTQPSLLSKYAYYQVRRWQNDYPLGFPIYDSLASRMYPIIAARLGLKRQKYFISESKNLDTNTYENNLSIQDYISALDSIRKVLFTDDLLLNGYQQFDILDALLWSMGKIDGGNISLLVNRKDYTKFIENLGLNAKQTNNGVYEERFKDYNKRMFDKYSAVINDKTKVSRDPEEIKPETKKIVYKADINALIKYELLKKKVKSFTGTSNFDYMSKLLEYYLMYINK